MTSPTLLAQTNQYLAILPLLGVMNLGLFGNFATLTTLAQVQQSVSSTNEGDLLPTVNVLDGPSVLYDTTPPALLAKVIGFVATIGTLATQVEDIKAATAYVTLQQLGLMQPDIPERRF